MRCSWRSLRSVAGGIQACTEGETVPQITRQCKLSAIVALTLVQYVTHSGPEVSFNTCVAMKFVDDDDDDDETQVNNQLGDVGGRAILCLFCKTDSC